MNEIFSHSRPYLLRPGISQDTVRSIYTGRFIKHFAAVFARQIMPQSFVKANALKKALGYLREKGLCAIAFQHNAHDGYPP